MRSLVSNFSFRKVKSMKSCQRFMAFAASLFLLPRTQIREACRIRKDSIIGSITWPGRTILRSSGRFCWKDVCVDVQPPDQHLRSHHLIWSSQYLIWSAPYMVITAPPSPSGDVSETKQWVVLAPDTPRQLWVWSPITSLVPNASLSC